MPFVDFYREEVSHLDDLRSSYHSADLLKEIWEDGCIEIVAYDWPYNLCTIQLNC